MIWTFGKSATAKHSAPAQFMQVRSAEQFMFLAWYCWHVTSGMPPAACTHAFAALGSPPRQVPAVPQAIRVCEHRFARMAGRV